MKKTASNLILGLFVILLAGCKSNPEAYSSTYRKTKREREGPGNDGCQCQNSS